MMLCIDGSDIASITFALVNRQERVLTILYEQTCERKLGDELRVIQDFLCDQGFDVSVVQDIGVVQGPGSAGALRSTLSLVNAWALGKGLNVWTLQRRENEWKIVAEKKPFVLPVYDRPVHATPSEKDALGRVRI